MIIFLDIDGVLNRGGLRVPGPNESMKSSWGGDSLFELHEPECVSNLNLILRETNAKIVLSSSWRLQSDLAEMRYVLTDWGVKPLRLVAATPAHVPGPWDDNMQRHLMTPRASEIKKWLSNNPDTMDNFVILDDQNIFKSFEMNIEDKLLESHFVRTKAKDGLTKEDAERAIIILKSGN